MFKIAKSLLSLCMLVALFQCFQLGQTSQEESCDETTKCGLSKIFASSTLEQNYRKIDRHLVKHLENNEDVESNMKEAIKWLEKEENKRFYSNSRIEALKYFTALAKIPDKIRCDEHSYKILLKNDKGTEGRAKAKWKQVGEPRRVDKIVHEYFVRNAKHCIKLYPSILKADQERLRTAWELDGHKLFTDRAQEFADGLLELYLPIQGGRGYAYQSLVDYLGYNPPGNIREMLSKTSIGGYQDAKAVYKHLKYLALNSSPDKIGKGGDYKIKPEKVEELFRLLEFDCNEYNSILGAVFVRLEFDSDFLEKNDHVYDRAELGFYANYGRYRMCKILFKQDNKSLIDEVVSIARAAQH